jgi:uncharacterized protein YbaA (DUF1428 family)
MKYVDGYVFAIPKKNVKAYLRMAQMGHRLWMKHGALNYTECIGDDLTPKWGALFPRMTRLQRGETVVFSYIVFKSRVHRDRVNAKVRKEIATMSDQSTQMPFDLKRMAYAGFKVAVGG